MFQSVSMTASRMPHFPAVNNGVQIWVNKCWNQRGNLRLFLSDNRARVSKKSYTYRRKEKAKKRIYLEYTKCRFDKGGKVSYIARLKFILNLHRLHLTVVPSNSQIYPDVNHKCEPNGYSHDSHIIIEKNKCSMQPCIEITSITTRFPITSSWPLRWRWIPNNTNNTK